eukprot:6207474-Pleurochrysis_carterae.AAC.3
MQSACGLPKRDASTHRYIQSIRQLWLQISSETRSLSASGVPCTTTSEVSSRSAAAAVNHNVATHWHARR